MNHYGRFLVLSAILASVVALPASPFSLEPMTASLAPSGPAAIGTFRLKNDSTERIAIKLSIVRRSMAPDGTELNTPADQLFTIYPARIVLAASSVATFKIQWKGSASTDSELCFRLLAEQVPVDSNDSQSSGIRILFRYVASLYVTPAASTWNVTVQSVIGTVDKDGNKGFYLEVLNRGNRHVVAVDTSFALTATEPGTEPLVLSGESTGKAEGANYLPGLLRQFFIPHQDAIPGRLYEAVLHFTPGT